jgi:AcrR family transcriptional regulator
MAIDRPGATTSRLTIDDWVQAGFAILAEEGMTALKIERLCSRLAVTKGSFYWHFTDIAGISRNLDRGVG